MSRRIGVALVAVALAAVAWRSVAVRAIDWSPFTGALPDAGAVDGEFTVDHPGRYELAIEIDRPPDVDRTHRAECLLGFDRADCGDTAGMRVEWRLESGGHPVAVRLASGGSFTTKAISRSVAAFDAVIRGRYQVRAFVLSGPAGLRAFRPRIVVVPASSLNRDRDSTTAAVWMMSAIVGLAGLLLAETRA